MLGFIATTPPRNAMAVCAHILGESPVPLWGLSSRERVRRLLKRAGVTDVVEDVGSVPPQQSVLLVHGEYLYDDRVINSLAKTPNVVLQIPSGHRRIAVAAHVPSSLASQARNMLGGAATTDAVPGVRVEAPQTLASPYQEQLRKFDPPSVEPITPGRRRELEQRLFSGAYKGVTDLITKWVWPLPARWATRVCVRSGIRPNHVTMASLVLAVAAGTLFAYGVYSWGLAAGWLMTFLDTVDGKLARVTVTSSRFGHLLDHGLDVIHPPLWYIAWGLGLATFQPGVPWLSLSGALWLTAVGYVVGRLSEGAFQLWLGTFEIFCWRRIDSCSRLIIARRNPNLILLTGGAAFGRPDVGLMAVALWTGLSSLLLLVRLTMAWRARIASGPLRPWLLDIDRDADDRSLAARLFTRQTPAQSSWQP